MKKLKLLPIFILSFFSAFGQKEIPQAHISNGEINVLLYLPDINDGYYRATRFDWSGIVASLQYKGHEFFGKWFDKYDPFIHDAVMGPVEEFGEEGYETIARGGTFLKIGVGLLTKPDDKPYDHFRLYPIKNQGKWKVRKSDNEVRYTHKVSDKNYSYIYEKRLKLSPGKPELVILHTFRNTGKLPVSTTVYDHNFPVIDSKPVGQCYTVSFPFNVSDSVKLPLGLISIKDKKLIYLRNQTKTDMLYIRDLPGYGNKAEDYDIRIENIDAGAGIRIRCDRPIIRLAYWSSATTVCPEPYIRVEALPGEEITWELRYEFYLLNSR